MSPPHTVVLKIIYYSDGVDILSLKDIVYRYQSSLTANRRYPLSCNYDCNNRIVWSCLCVPNTHCTMPINYMPLRRIVGVYNYYHYTNVRKQCIY